MNYRAAKREVITKRIVGALLAVLSALFVLAGLLLFLYTSLDAAGQTLENVSLGIKRLVYSVFANTQILLPIWNNAPVPNPDNIISKSTLGFLGWYMGMFVGVSLIASANKLARRLCLIDEQIEDEAIRESLRGRTSRSRAELKLQVSVPSQPIWQQFHTLYVAPLVVGLILWLGGKAIG